MNSKGEILLTIMSSLIDFLSKKRVVNNGIVPQYYVENSYEAIIPINNENEKEDKLRDIIKIH